MHRREITGKPFIYSVGKMDEIPQLRKIALLGGKEGSSHALKGLVDRAESSATTEGVSGDRDRRKHVARRVPDRDPIFPIGTSLVLLSSLLIILLAQSVAQAGDFSSQTFNSHQSYSGIRMQGGSPQLDNDKKPLLLRPSASIAPRIGSVNMQQGKILRDVDAVKAIRRDNSSAVLCNSNCRK
jgi:hypothetical protein